MGVIDETILGLNRSWQPTSVYSVKVAITMLMREQAFAMDPETYELHDFESWVKKNPQGLRTIRTSSGYLSVPEIIVLKAYNKLPPTGLSFNRHYLYQRDEFTCQYCGKELPASKLTIDHVVPKSRGGHTTYENCVSSCSPCNSKKADRSLQEAGMRLRTKPKRPRPPAPGPRVGRSKRRPSWEPFLSKNKH